MKAFKISGGILSIFVALYLAFLFVLPNAIDLNKYSPQITKVIQNNTGYQTIIENLKVKTYWNLAIGASANKADLLDANGEKFAQINGLQIKVSLLPLLMKKIRITELKADKILANIDNKIENTSSHTHTYTTVSKLPNISVKKYRISFINGAENYTLKGSDLKISDFVLNEKIKIKAIGDVILNDRKQISYNIALLSEVLPSSSDKKTDNKTELIKIFEDLYKYNTQAKINANLKINKRNNEVNINGKIKLDEISLTIGEKTIPKSFVYLDFMDNKAKINSTLYSDENSKAVVSGIFKNGKNKYIDLHVVSRAELQNLVLMSKTLLKILGKKDLDGINANGLISADFDLKSDFKKIDSNGYLKIKNANISNNLYNVALNSVNADIDFSQDFINLKKANASLNGQPITIKGSIDKNANANIQILANNLQLKGLLFASGNTKILKENNVSGLVDIKALVKGRLDKVIPQINALATNINIINKKSSSQIKITKAIINTNTKSQGKAEITGLKISPKFPAILSAPKIILALNNKEVNIEPTSLYINQIKTTLSGKISDINSNPQLNSVTVNIPNQVSVPIEGYANSKIVLSGNLILNGNPSQPKLQGTFNIPLIKIPTTSTVIKNSTLLFNNDLILNCPQVQVADSLMKVNAIIKNDFSNGLIAKNVNFSAQTFDLNTLIPIFKTLPKNSNSSLTILNGKNSVGTFKVGSITSSNITSSISMKDNLLHLDDLNGEAYLGKIAGNISYDITHRNLKLNLQGRGLSANPAITALTRRNDDINGILDFDSNISMVGFSKKELLNSLKGDLKFIISNGKMGVLGKFEHLLYAQNIVSNNVFKTSLNLVARAIMAKNTGVYRYMKGKISFADGWANIGFVKTSGPSMSLYMTGRYNLLYNTANLTILGRISDDVVRILGPVGEFSVSKAISSIPKIDDISTSMVNQLSTNPNYENISEIPYLTPKTEFKTKEFKVIIDGEVQKQSSVKSFKWLATPKVIQPEIERPVEQPKAEVPDFVKNLPDLKN